MVILQNKCPERVGIFLTQKLITSILRTGGQNEHIITRYYQSGFLHNTLCDAHFQ